MDELKANISINVELKNNDFLADINQLSAIYDLSLEEVIIFALKKLIADVRFMNNIRAIHN